MITANYRPHIVNSNFLCSQEVRLKSQLCVSFLLGLCLALTLTFRPAVAMQAQKAAVAAKLSGYLQIGLNAGEWMTKAEPPASKLTASISRQGRWQNFREWQMSSRGGDYSQSPYLTMEATAYEPSPVSCGPHARGFTATGMRADYGVVAVDPRVIPLGTRVYVEGYGTAIAADTGGAIKGNRIDLCYRTVHEAMQYGRRMTRVYILGR